MSTDQIMADGPRTMLEPGFQASPPPGDSALTPRPDGTPAQASLLLADIATALHENLERGYLEAEERLRQIAEALNLIVALTSENVTKLYYVNAAYERIWGRTRDELYANPLTFLDGVHPDDRDRVRDAIVLNPNAAYDLEFRVVQPNGVIRWVWCRGFPVRDASGAVYRMASITEDITERRQVLDSHQRLIRGFTHDVKNPLGAADGFLALLEAGIFGEISSQQTEGVVRARRSIQSALALVSQLLDIEKAEAGEVKVDRAGLDLGAVAREAVEEFRGAADVKRQTLELLPSRETDTLVIQTDAARVRQILANLLSNAVKYTQPGGRITVRAHVAGDAEAPWPGGWMAITVADNGPGIAPAKQKMLFREFARFDPAAAAGSGIGLAISQRLAFALGATITFTSTPGAGSAFTVWLPIEPPARAEGDLAHATSHPADCPWSPPT